MGTPPERVRVARAGVLAAVALALGVGVGIGFVVGRAGRPASPPPDPEPLVQAGDLTPPVAPDGSGWRGPVEVFYPVPYASPPELTFPVAPRSFRVKEQRADGFKVEITECETDRTPSWHAKGRPRPRGM